MKWEAPARQKESQLRNIENDSAVKLDSSLPDMLREPCPSLVTTGSAHVLDRFIASLYF